MCSFPFIALYALIAEEVSLKDMKPHDFPGNNNILSIKPYETNTFIILSSVRPFDRPALHIAIFCENKLHFQLSRQMKY